MESVIAQDSLQNQCETSSAYTNLRFLLTIKSGQPLIDTLLEAVESAAPDGKIPIRYAIVEVHDLQLVV